MRAGLEIGPAGIFLRRAAVHVGRGVGGVVHILGYLELLDFSPGGYGRVCSCNLVLVFTNGAQMDWFFDDERGKSVDEGNEHDRSEE
mmetsp:Transcript_6491/g.14332  ORF Transcript_6491/g.14332 Transcript_6491/m.14332 type:complete len:87 (-) Transcript_6491:579-839(-)